MVHTGLFELATLPEHQIVLQRQQNRQIRYHPSLASVSERIVYASLDELMDGTVNDSRIPTKFRGPREHANLDDGMSCLLKVPPGVSYQSLLF